MISPATREEWRRKAKSAFLTSALDEYCPSEFLELLDAYEELVREREAVREIEREA